MIWPCAPINVDKMCTITTSLMISYQHIPYNMLLTHPINLLYASHLLIYSDIQDDEDDDDDEEEYDDEDEEERTEPGDGNNNNNSSNNNNNNNNNNNSISNNHNKRSSSALKVRKVPFLYPKPLRVLLGHKLAITDLSWSKSNFLLSASVDKQVMVCFAAS